MPPRTVVNVDGIPSDIKSEKRWVCWKWKRTDSKWTKAPVQVAGRFAKSSDSTTWDTFENVINAYHKNPSIAGIGFVLGDGFAGVDLDSCYDPNTDEADPIISKVVREIDSYTEISPSRTGVKILARGTLPEGKRQSDADSKYDLECYDSGRFFTITGQAWKGTRPIVQGAARELAWFHKTYIDPNKANDAANLNGFNANDWNERPDRVNDVDKGREALRNIPRHYSDTYADWIAIGLAAKSCGDLFREWEQWSAQSVKYVAGECQKKWDGFKTTEIGVGTLIKLGKESGWVPSWESKPTSTATTDDTKSDQPKPRISPMAIGRLIEDYPDMRPVVIDGILRKGETANFIAAAKVGKSFLAGGLAWSIATGIPWLGHDVTEGRVAIIDNELHPQTLAHRLYRIAMEMMIDYRDHREAIDVFSVRGVGVDIHHIGGALAAIESGRYELVILDALYRTLPDGTSENDNAAMMAIYNRLDYYARQWDCAVAVVHHASKGEQGGKSVTDVGAGAGAISRAADTHIVIRPHEQTELSVMECKTRSFKSPEPVSLRFDWPLWHQDTTKPTVRIPKGLGDAKQEAMDKEAEEAVRSALVDSADWLAASSIRRKVGFGQTRVDRALIRLCDEIESQSIPNPRNKNEAIDVYRLRDS